MDALFGSSPVRAKPGPSRTVREEPAPSTSAAAKRSRIVVPAFVIAVAGLIALYVQLYSRNTEQPSIAATAPANVPAPKAIQPAIAPTRSESAAATPITPAPTDDSPMLRALLAVDRQTPRPAKAAVEPRSPEKSVASVADLAPTPKPVAGLRASTPDAVAPAVTSSATAPPPAIATPAATVGIASPVPAVAAASQLPVAVSDSAPAARMPAALVPVSRAQPIYPQQALLDRVTGRVVARLSVGSDGTVTAIQIESSSPPRVFDRAASAALRQWRYAPIDQPQQTTVELEFKLE